jgi:membrane peptidoglycan carboxypeptidase
VLTETRVRIFPFAKRIRPQRWSTRVNLVFCLLLTGLVIGHTAYYAWAVRFLNQANLQSRGDLSGAIFFATPRRVSVGEETSRESVIDFLRRINFAESADANKGGTYLLSGRNRLRVISRFSEFPSVIVTFQKGRVSRIQDLTGADLTQVELEPETLATFVETIKGDNNTKNFLARRQIVRSDDVLNTDLFYAIMASEDGAFLEHHGLRYLHLLLSVFQGRGGSSISAQVVKNAVAVDSSHSLLRKLNEIYLSVALEERLSKAEIFELYVNHTYLGSIEGGCSLYGYQAAASEYFSKSRLRDLTLNEASVLAGMTDGPNNYLESIRKGDYARITERRDRVLRLLHKNWPERYSSEAIDAASREPIHFLFTSEHTETKQLDQISKAFVDFAKSQPGITPLANLPAAEYSGLHVYTSIDPDLMRAALKALNNHLLNLQRQFPPVDNRTNQPVKDHLLGSIIAIDPHTGEIITMVGRGAGNNGLDLAKPAVNAIGPPASTIKPLFTAKALTESVLSGGQRYTAATVIDPRKGQVANWRPDIGVSDQPMRVRECISRSDDGCAAYTLDLVGLQSGAELYDQVTGTRPSPISGLLSIGFGAHTEISGLTQAIGYSLFANQGVPASPTAIYRVFQNGQELDVRQAHSQRALIDPGAAYITAQLLRSPLGWGFDGSVGTARNAEFARTFLRAHPEIEMGGKTGSGPNNLWMVSVGPRLVVAVLIAYQNNSKFLNAERVTAAKTATVVWSDFMREVSKERPDLLAGHWARPRNVQTVSIDFRRGCQIDNGIEEYFLTGTLPKPCETR